MIRNDKPWLKFDSSRQGIPEEARVISPASRFAEESKSGQNVSFRMADIYAPSLPDLFKQITPGLELEGRIVLLSDGGETRNAFALVEVKGILQPLIVPASCLELISDDAAVLEAQP